MPAVNYTPLSDTQDAEADVFNTPLQELDDAIEAMKDGTAALSAPDITSFANALHDHEDAAGGGLLTADALDSTGASDGDVATADGAGGVAWEAKPIPLFHRRGLRPFRAADAGKIFVETGSVVAEGVAINKTTMTVLDLPTDGHWIDGTSAEAASMWVWVYIDSAGNIRLHDAAPNYSAPESTNRLCEARVNQAGWDGTAGNGLDETSVVYDDGAGGDPTGEGDIEAGMLLGVYTDSAYETGRGKASAATGSKNYRSFALITAVDSGANTLTLEADHEIAMQDNDYLIVIENGPPLYLYDGSTWWYALGALWNDSSGDLSYHRRNNQDHQNPYTEVGITTSSTSFVDVSAALLTLELQTNGGDIEVEFSGVVAQSTAAKYVYMDVAIDGRRVGGDDGIVAGYYSSGYVIFNFSFNRTLTTNYHGITPGNHTLVLQWAVDGGEGRLYNGETPNVEIHPQFMAREVVH